MKKSIILIVLLVVVKITFADTHIPAGNVSGNWAHSNSPYIIDGEINIQVGDELTIEPGVDVIFSEHYKFNVFGRLYAVGTVTDTITFTAQNTNWGWFGLRFYDTDTNGQSTSNVIYCKLEYGKANDDIEHDAYGGAIYCNNSSIEISNCLIQNNYARKFGGGIYSYNSSLIISYNTIINNSIGYNEEIFDQGCGGGIYCNGDDININIIYNVIENNSITAEITGEGSGAGIYFLSGGVLTIENNTIRYNNINAVFGSKGGGIYFYSYGTGSSTIQDNTISDNSIFSINGSAEGGGIYGEGTSTIQNNIISNNSADSNADDMMGRPADALASGGGIYCLGSTDILNNEIINNSLSAMSNSMDDASAYVYGGGIRLSHATNFSFNLIAGNTASANAMMAMMSSEAFAYGGGVYCWGSVDMINNTITENSVSASAETMDNCSMYIDEFECEMAPDCYWDPVLMMCLSLNQPYEETLGGGVYFNSASTMINSILWNNYPDEIYGSATVNYSDIRGGYARTGNIDLDPLFVDPENDDFHLTENSPCIDAGDPTSPLDPDGTRADMGAYYFHQSGDLNPPENVTIYIESDTVFIYWDIVIGATEYKVYSDSNPYGDFSTLEWTGSATSWNESIEGDDKKFYHVTAID